MKDNIRVRMAPSPTGFFHIGSARTALYNWLFARHFGGRFIIRVEDTDAARSSKEMIDVILNALEWLGLDYDEGPEKGGDYGPYFQSERKDIYQRYVTPLLEASRAYWCFCTTEEIARERDAGIKEKGGWQYDRRCFRLSAEEVKRRIASGMPRTLRFLIPDKTTVRFEDLIHGPVEKMSSELEDFIIIKSDGMPTYNFACVVDDFEMKISHVIRGVEHISNTPKQVLLYEVLNLPKPFFAHLPIILGPDKKKMSKRLGARSLLDYHDEGYLPEAVLNILVLLGWSPGGDREIMNREEMVKSFSLERINPANAVFDEERLTWMNNQYIMKLDDAQLADRLVPYILKYGLMTEAEISRQRQWLCKVCGLLKPRLHRLDEIDERGRFFFREDFPYDDKALKKHLDPETTERLRQFRAVLEGLASFDRDTIERALRDYVTENKLKPGDIIHPLRVFITGRPDGPGLFETLELLGWDKCRTRIENVLRP